jgi:hypothetical protein
VRVEPFDAFLDDEDLERITEIAAAADLADTVRAATIEWFAADGKLIKTNR